MIDVQIMTPSKMLWQGNVESVTVPGDRGDYEICDYHKAVVGALRKGNIILNMGSESLKSLGIKGGVSRFDNNNFVALVELD